MELYKKIRKLAFELGFADVGCARAEALGGEETAHYRDALSKGFFGEMSYLERNTDKREDPTLLLPGAKSVLVFLAPFSFTPDASSLENSSAKVEISSRLKVSEFALGTDYHTVIKDKLYRIAQLLDGKFRVFTDSAPIMERAWAVRAGLGFIGKNNFLISRSCGVKNFIGIILTTVELPYYQLSKEMDKSGGAEKIYDVCGSCTRCIDACSQKALFAPRKIDARKCLSYKTIEKPLTECDDADEMDNNPGWIFGCDDCMNACPWNRLNHKGWDEFHVNAHLLRSVPGSAELAPGEKAEWWRSLSEEEFDKLFSASPLQRAGLAKIIHNLLLNSHSQIF